MPKMILTSPIVQDRSVCKTMTKSSESFHLAIILGFIMTSFLLGWLLSQRAMTHFWPPTHH